MTKSKKAKAEAAQKAKPATQGCNASGQAGISFGGAAARPLGRCIDSGQGMQQLGSVGGAYIPMHGYTAFTYIYTRVR